jgi:hypothetical protein
MQPPTVVVNVKRDAESDAAAELFGAASGLGTRRQVIDDIDVPCLRINVLPLVRTAVRIFPLNKN